MGKAGLPNLHYDHVYAIVRIDGDVSLEDIALAEHLITVKKIVRSYERATSEVERLNKLNADKGCVYFLQMTRLEPTE